MHILVDVCYVVLSLLHPLCNPILKVGYSGEHTAVQCMCFKGALRDEQAYKCTCFFEYTSDTALSVYTCVLLGHTFLTYHRVKQGANKFKQYKKT